MKIFQIIKCANDLGEFVNKNYELPFLLRRAIKKNYKVLYEEYSIFDEERKKLLADGEKDKITELLNTEIDIELVKVDVNVLADVKMPYKDELLIEFMLSEEE